MEIVEQSWAWVQKPDLPLQVIEAAGRTCYKSEEKITEGSAEKFAKTILRSGHESVIEHVNASVRFVTNRGVTHELVRHRLCAYCQESTRYCDYGGEGIAVIKPVWWDDEEIEDADRKAWIAAMGHAERYYTQLRELGWKPQQARDVLPIGLKTEIVVTANMREWRHIFRLRTTKKAHPQIRALMLDCLWNGFKEEIPILFDDFISDVEAESMVGGSSG